MVGGEGLTQIGKVEKKFPVIEIFGPTIQGEGSIIGAKTMFIRFGGCDFRCTWCDSLHAVLPKEVKKNSTSMNSTTILKHLRGELPRGRIQANWVTLTGGNPAIQKNLGELICKLQEVGYDVMLETQGSIFPDWISQCDAVTISPKGPTSGEMQDIHDVVDFVNRYRRKAKTTWCCIKPVVFDTTDYFYAKELYKGLLDKHNSPRVPFYIQCGTEKDESSEAILKRLRWIADKVCNDPVLKDVYVLPQMHVLIWGHGQGV